MGLKYNNIKATLRNTTFQIQQIHSVKKKNLYQPSHLH